MKQKKVAIFYAGERELTSGDFKRWLHAFPEIGVLAKVEPFYLSAEKGGVSSPLLWQNLAKQIEKQWSGFDGFVVLHPIESILFAASALSYIFAPQTKPIVFTGSPFAQIERKENDQKSPDEWKDLDARANLLNSVQIASTARINETIVVSGNRLLRANRAKKMNLPTFNLFEADSKGFLGKIDFFINPQKAAAKTSRAVKKRIKFDLESNIGVIDVYPGFDLSVVSAITEGKKGILIRANNSRDLEILAPAANIFQKTITAVYCVQQRDWEPIGLWKEILIPSKTVSFEAALTKLMWVLPQSKKWSDAAKIFSRDIAGEYGEAV